MKFWGNLIIIVVTAIVAYSLKWETPSWLPIILDWDIAWWIPTISGLVILRCWTAMCDNAKQHNADLEKLKEQSIAAYKELLNTPAENAWSETRAEIERALATNRAPIFWEKWFELQDTIKNYQNYVLGFPQRKRKLQDSEPILGKTTHVKLLPEEEIFSWFRVLHSVLDEVKQRALENSNFHNSYITVNQARKQDAHNQRMELLAKETERNTAMAADAAKRAADASERAATEAGAAASDAAKVKRNQSWEFELK